MIFLFLSILFHVLASVLLKFGAVEISEFNLISILTNVFYLLSLFFFFLQAIAWQYSLKKYSLNYAYMFTSLYYPLILGASYFIFKESISIGNILGTLIIGFGIAFSKKPE